MFTTSSATSTPHSSSSSGPYFTPISTSHCSTPISKQIEISLHPSQSSILVSSFVQRLAVELEGSIFLSRHESRAEKEEEYKNDIDEREEQPRHQQLAQQQQAAVHKHVQELEAAIQELYLTVNLQTIENAFMVKLVKSLSQELALARTVPLSQLQFLTEYLYTQSDV
jgi:hypothetical protein